MENRNKTIAAILALLFGPLGIHKFYLGDKTSGLIYLLCTIVGWIFSIILVGIIPVIIIAILSLIDCIMLLLMGKDKFDSIYN